ncbi:MAG: ArnT family glycosyltransferase [Gemmatimonadales bacterium]
MLVAAFAYAALTIDRGWIPHDEGTLAQSALRALTGELPHRDFHDMYTGGLSYWHALSFVLFGIRLTSPRVLLLAAYAGFLVVSYAVARRFVTARPAAASVLLAGVWSVPNYPAAMPTWYNLFLAMLGLWCLMRFVESPRDGWLFACGVACGLSIVVKVVGLYTLAATLIGLVLIESEAGRRPSAAGPTRPTLYTGAVAVGLGVYVMLVFWLVRTRLDPASIVHFVAPSAVVAAVASWCVTRSGGIGTATERTLRLGRLVVPVLAGATLPVAIFLIPYVATGSLGDLLDGTLVLPRRMEFAAARPLPLGLFWPTLVPLALAAGAAAGPPRVRTPALAALAATLLLVLMLGARDGVYRAVWGGLVLTPSIATVAALVASLSGTPRGSGTEPDRRPLLAALVAAFLGTFVLVQYPFSGPVYFFYVAPLVVLAALAAASLSPAPWRSPTAALYAFALLFGALRVGTGALFPTAQGRHEPRPPLERLALERGGIRVPAADEQEYETVVGMLQQLAGESGTTFVTPDAPELYFLSGLRNPTPVLFDFFDEPEGRTERTLALLDREGVRVVALNRAPQVSGPPAPDLVAALERRYPRAASAGRFVVRWR